MKRLALLFAVTTAAFGELQLSTFDGTRETPASALFDAGSVAVGDSLELRFHVRNLGTASANLTSLSASGTGFTITSRPTLPYALLPGAFMEFRVGFTSTSAGSSSAVVTANSVSVILRATSTLAADVAQNISGNRVIVPSGASIDLGRIQRGQAVAQSMFLHNPGTTPLKVTKAAVSGESFSGTAGPVTLAPGDWLEFFIAFAPTRTGDLAGLLTVDQRTYVLRGLGFDPPLPKPTVSLDTTQIRNGEQHQVTLRLDAPSPVAGAGLLQIFFDSGIAAAPSDPAVQFVKTASRSANFSIAAGDTQARFGADAAAVFQTGTTAGTLRFQITITGQAVSNDLSVSLSPAPILIDTVSATRRIGILDLSLTGFDNTYSAGAASFTFFDSTGRAVDPGAIQADFTANFKTYFSTSSVGSAFQMRVSFPVSGDATQVAGVEAAFTNAAGVTRTQRIPFL